MHLLVKNLKIFGIFILSSALCSLWISLLATLLLLPFGARFSYMTLCLIIFVVFFFAGIIAISICHIVEIGKLQQLSKRFNISFEDAVEAYVVHDFFLEQPLDVTREILMTDLEKARKQKHQKEGVAILAAKFNRS